jgi:MFS family permease
MIMNDYLFYTVTFCARVIEGISMSILLVGIQSLISIEYRENLTLYFAIFELSIGLGLVSGPIVSILIYQWLDYTGTLIFFASLIALVSIPIAYSLPKRLNDSSELSQGDSHIQNISYGQLLSNRRIVMVAFAVMIESINHCFLEPILTLYEDDFDGGVRKVGIGFVVQSLTYTAFSIPLSIVIERFGIRYRYCIGFSILMCAISDLLISGLLMDDYYAMMFGLGLQGVCLAGMLVPSIPEIVQAFQDKLEDDRLLV